MCSSCGEVIAENVAELGPESSAQSGEDYLSKSRTGRKSTLAFNDMGLSTVIQQSDKDATGKNLSGEMKRTFYRLRMWDKNSKALPGHRNMQKAFTLLEGLKAKLSLTDAAVEQAAYIYRKTLSKKIGRGRSIPMVLSASVFMQHVDLQIHHELYKILQMQQIYEEPQYIEFTGYWYGI